MNIFVLHNDPAICARYHNTAHVTKMILETAQLIIATADLCKAYDKALPYKPTHINHPCRIWVGESRYNLQWLTKLLSQLNKEFRFRYGHNNKDHKAYTAILRDMDIPLLFSNLPDVPMTPFKQCMPDKYRGKDAIEAYRKYYINEKKHLARWGHRGRPYWYPVSEQYPNQLINKEK